jgi:hypothetical protein
MKITSTLLLSVLTYTFLNAQINRPVGVNLSAVSDYSTELVFTDVFKQCRRWISCNADNTGSWDSNINIPLRPDGYPIEIPYSNGINPPQKLKTLLIWDLFGATPTGVFRLKASGKGKIKLANGASGTYDCPVDTLIQVNNGVILEILHSDVNNPIHHIRFVLPKYVNTYTSQTFTEELLQFVKDFQIIRFMDFTHTNGSPISYWEDRTMPEFYSQAKYGGVAWEYVTQLANLTQKDSWINIPHQATDGFVDSLAHFLQDNLNPGIKIYLEYSNEVWNSIFAQHTYSALMAQNLGYSGQQWERAWKYTAKRSADIFRIFENVFTDDNRLVKIIPAQAANSWLSDQLITLFESPTYNPHQVKADALAIGPYFGGKVADDLVNNNLVDQVTIPQIIDLVKESLPETFNWINLNKNIAENHNLTLLAYEGGQHLVGTGNNINNNTLTQKLMDTNRDTAMESIYCSYLNFWYEQVGSPFCHFSSVGKYSKWGSWGILESFQDNSSAKYQAIQQCVFTYNDTPPLNTEAPKSFSRYLLFPNPVYEILTIATDDDTTPEYRLYNNLGKWLAANTGKVVDMKNLNAGIYYLIINETPYKVVKW